MKNKQLIIKEKWNGANSRFEDYPDEWDASNWKPLNEVAMSVSKPMSRYTEEDREVTDEELPF